jgi:hypothetical protein
LDDGAHLGKGGTATARFEHFDLIYLPSWIGGQLNCWFRHFVDSDEVICLWSLEFAHDTPADVVIGAITGVFEVSSAQDAIMRAAEGGDS